MVVALYGQTLKSEYFGYIQQMIDKLGNTGCRIKIYSFLYQEMKGHLHFHREPELFTNHTEIRDVDVLFSIGGDGTLLGTIGLVRDSGVPVLGVNTGKLGFLSSVSKEEIIRSIDEILAGRYGIEERSLIRLEMPDNPFKEINYGLNEVMINKRAPMSMITIHTWVNGVFLNSFWGDGLIVSTPTGSTGYSMSCGGPIILPESRSFVITPIATHNLTVRPVVIPDDCEIRLRVEGRDPVYYAGIDSRSYEIQETSDLVIRKEDFPMRLIRMENQHFFKTIRTKLKWGIDVRN